MLLIKTTQFQFRPAGPGFADEIGDENLDSLWNAADRRDECAQGEEKEGDGNAKEEIIVV